jgi:hypothetical protein
VGGDPRILLLGRQHDRFLLRLGEVLGGELVPRERRPTLGEQVQDGVPALDDLGVVRHHQPAAAQDRVAHEVVARR